MPTVKSSFSLAFKLKPFAFVALCSILASALISAVFHAVFAHSPISFWIILDFIFESIFVVALYTFCRSWKAVIGVQVFIGILLRVANEIKISYLGMPILPSDFYLVRDAFEILPNAQCWIFSLVATFPLVLSGYLISRDLRWPRNSDWFGIVPILIITTWLLGFPESYSNTFNLLLKKEIFGVPFLLKERSEALGAPVSFSIDFAKFLMVERSRPTAQQVTEAFSHLNRGSQPTIAGAAPNLKRNVYILLVESFWDPSEKIPTLGSESLAPEFRKLWGESGHQHLLSPMFGGGTANVEFEMLCGIPARPVAKGIVFQVALSNHLNCLPKILNNMGYGTYAFHPFAPGYYNRNTAFPLLGFEEFVSIKDFKPDAVSGDFVADDAFIHESLSRARKMANGKPFLAYMMTFAGHWPFAWIPNLYEKKINLQGKDKNPDLEVLERHLNVNRVSSDVIAYVTDEILKDDPGALIVVAGDHQPLLAKDLFNIENGDEIADGTFYQTPLLFVDQLQAEKTDRSKPEFKSEMPAYTVGLEILHRLHIPVSLQSHFPWFEPPLLIRPVQNGATIVKRQEPGANYENCTPISSEPDCKTAHEWLKSAHVLGLDLVAGSQHALSDQLRLPASKTAQ